MTTQQYFSRPTFYTPVWMTAIALPVSVVWMVVLGLVFAVMGVALLADKLIKLLK